MDQRDLELLQLSNLVVRVETALNSLTQRVNKLEELLEDKYVTEKEFSPIRNLVFGGAAIVLSSFIAGAVKVVMALKLG